MGKATVGIVGSYGYVGRAMAEFFEKKYKVLLCDKDVGTLGLKDLDACDLLVICLPTPQKRDGGCETTLIEWAVRESEAELIVIKSTIPPGTTDMLSKKYSQRIVFCPEFIGEGGYFDPHGFSTEVIQTPWFVFGGANGRRDWAEEVADFYAPIAGPSKKYCITDAKTAELVKYWNNTYFALKVSFANEMRRVCESMGINFYEARELWAQDPRNDSAHSLAFKNSRGFGGKCLPKDLAALISACHESNYEPKLLTAIENFNEGLKK